ncbi:uncharacterized protein [Asterias amurensis]|uniref:uncharacterized protein isoform X2 n=1 Tax=Asterias amurensis TaxID=7602 RepID=UPI003AB475B0
MAYKPRVALGASITLIICSLILMGLFVVCATGKCVRGEVTYGSPLWTGGLALLTGIIGVYMSATKSEKGCGPLFLALSIICTFISLACIGLSIYAMFYIFFYVDFYFWLAIASMALILSIVSCVTSCQHCCCCQETRPIQIVVYHGGHQVPQNIVLTNTNTTQHPQQQGQPQMVFLNPYGAPQGGQFVPQGYSAPQVLNQPLGGAPGCQLWYPPTPDAASGVHVRPIVAPVQPHPSAPPPPYQEQIPDANQIRPVTTAPDQSQAAQPSTTPPAQPPNVYQELIKEENTQMRSPEVLDDGSYVDPNKASSSPPENSASRIDSGAYVCIEEPSYDYADPGLAREFVSPAERSEYVNDSVAKRPKAKRPK